MNSGFAHRYCETEIVMKAAESASPQCIDPALGYITFRKADEVELLPDKALKPKIFWDALHGSGARTPTSLLSCETRCFAA